ncbi:hypothetical protein BBJ28_00011006 [Nothophytophthora sp. Chile5]|nr:hypothetical protein BBJ28_00011006 [Nothophytophthora sp. Chile5]
MSFSHPNSGLNRAGDSDYYVYSATGYQVSPNAQQQPQYPFAVPVDTVASPPPAPQPTQQPPQQAGFVDYSRPQTWRNMLTPQIDASHAQQRRLSTGSNENRTLSAKMDATIRPRRSSSTTSDLSATSFESYTPPPAYSDVAMAANASVAASGVAVAAPAAAFTSERGSVSSPTSSATRGSVDAAVDTMWEARRAREKAEEEADRKLVEAVCKASLAEFNDRERALKSYESERSQKTLEHQSSSAALQQAKSEAEQRKRAAMQTVIDSKTRARQMSEKAREATSQYELKNAERLAKQAELEALKQRDQQELELRAVQERKEAAILKRTEAEQRAREAREKAEEMRRNAIQAASKVRANSRRQIETQLGHEEEQRQREMQSKLDEIERIKAQARERKEAAAKKAEDARRRADELRARAERARLGLKSPQTSESTSSA